MAQPPRRSLLFVEIFNYRIFHLFMPRALRLKSDYINILLDMAAERTRERGSRVYEEKFGVSLRDIRLLRMIGSAPGITMGQLVQQSAIEKTLASKLVGALVKRDLVQREISTEDARQVCLFLSEAGVDLVRRAEPLGIELEAGFLHCLTPAEIDALRATLVKLIEAEAASRESFERYLQKLRERGTTTP
ncbi:transcriptional regulator, MarR-family [Cupriavidus necator H16]|uniref:Transcriptional regulator, MarR-family n=2 Tax=Cupriavidus necator (strain ATCC 17699 / DSM 428 / KCTC 22496 / NCIMB 10442 / H16 / Stanier 337) TaxID=381666 RepID=Q0K9Z1_CUPNH|nr:transcriptional regulator, MarR-family [Cupriavidus necator H16]